MKKFNQMFFRGGAFLLLFCLFFGVASAQKSVRGTVIDAKGNGIGNVNIILKGSNKGTTTDSLGKFSVTANDNSVLEFSIVGYLRKEINIGTQSVIDVTLENSTENIAEVVVTALGIKREKKSLGYSVQEISGDAVSTAKEANVANALAGKMAGVQVTRSANGAGGSSRVIIRGSNSLVGNSQPLYVIDGIIINNTPLTHKQITNGTIIITLLIFNV